MKKLVLILSLMSSSVFAQMGKPHVCAEDVRKLCSNQLSQGEVASCVRVNKDKLTGECRKLIFGAEDNARATHKNCRDDAKKFCEKVVISEGNLFECLLKNRKQLTLKCRKSIDKVIN